jgi:hypothetical protein
MVENVWMLMVLLHCFRVHPWDVAFVPFASTGSLADSARLVVYEG